MDLGKTFGVIVKIEKVNCRECEYEWWPRSEKSPARCPKCQCRKWDKSDEKGSLKNGNG
jgi:predicted Zn-ribbon and HTH transcriptional regulator